MAKENYAFAKYQRDLAKKKKKAEKKRLKEEAKLLKKNGGVMPEPLEDESTEPSPDEQE